MPVEKTLVEKTLVEKTLVEKTPVEKTPVEKTCGNCTYFYPWPHDEAIGECRRYPPVVLPVVEKSNGRAIAKRTFWPVLAANLICGEWKQKTSG